MLILLGPTAAGKTKLAIELAKKLNGEIISADSMQVYRGMDVGTAKPTLEERQGLPHHLIDVLDPDEPWTVSDFVEQANKLTKDIVFRGKVPLIVGGTGLYLWSLLEGFSFPIAPADKELRAKLEKEQLTALYSRLTAIDPAAAEKIHPNDKKRIIRALEVYELTGRPISHSQATRDPGLVTRDQLLIGLNLPREELYSRIDQRVDSMIEKGLIEEVTGLLAKGYSKELPSFQALGYKEAVEYLAGKWTKEQMIAELKKRTRHFARRQMTWFKRFNNVRWFEPPIDSRAILDYISSI
ncbi:MAG: tRNA (adenosine(37)-N6)-dimethylallyltransferase MiaA [Candidatus Margulisbacteria bacterium]|nr:tRNA (adenosine(37)-N6)-dimethylallyltransferase MiaA [Candidatus Margulisiibacteriota bacterium]